MPADPERAPPENGIEDMEVHGAIEGILQAATGKEPCSDQTSEMGDGEGPPAAMPSRKCSAVWRHYRKLDNEKKALCLLCKKSIQYHSSTSNLLRHLQKKHPSNFTRTGRREKHTDASSSAIHSSDQVKKAIEQHLQSPCAGMF